MTLPTFDLDARGITKLCSLGWIAFLTTLVGGGIVTLVSALKVEPQTYKREIIINLATPQKGKGQHKGNPRPPACDIAFGLRSDNDVLLQLERDAYTQVIQKHRLGELGVTEFRIFERGALAFRVSVTIDPDADPRITRLTENFNAVRSDLAQILRERVKEAEQQSELLASSIGWVNALEGEAARQLGDYLREELECSRYELQILQARLQDSNSPILRPDIRDNLMAASPLKTLIACLFATLIAAVLAALLTGYVRLARKTLRAKRDAVSEPKS